MQVRLPGTLKTNIREAGADVKESVFIQIPATWKVVDSWLKVDLIISGRWTLVSKLVSGVLASLYRGNLERRQQRNFWLYAASHCVLGWFPWYLLCAFSCGFIDPSTVLLLISGNRMGSQCFCWFWYCYWTQPVGVGSYSSLPTQQNSKDRVWWGKKGIFYITIISFAKIAI